MSLSIVLLIPLFHSQQMHSTHPRQESRASVNTLAPRFFLPWSQVGADADDAVHEDQDSEAVAELVAEAAQRTLGRRLGGVGPDNGVGHQYLLAEQAHESCVTTSTSLVAVIQLAQYQAYIHKVRESP